MRALLRRTPLLLLAALAAAWSGGCGEPRSPGGYGRLEASAERGGIALLQVEGSPYEMGWHQGHLLRDRIRRLHRTWAAALFATFLPEGETGPAAKSVRERLDQHCALCLDQTEYRLSEVMLQELAGMAAGCGLTRSDLLKLDVLRDALRMKGLGARLTGALGIQLAVDGYEVRGWWSGPDADLLASEWIVVRRVPDEGPATLALSWPGSLGAVAALRDNGVGYASAQGHVSESRRMGFGGGRPFPVAARESLLEADSAEDLTVVVTGTMGNAMVCFSVPRPGEARRIDAMASFQVYGYPDPPWLPGPDGFIAVGPYERLDAPGATALREAVHAVGQRTEERWLRLQGHAEPTADTAPRGPALVIRWGGGEGTLRVRRPGDAGTALEVGFEKRARDRRE